LVEKISMQNININNTPAIISDDGYVLVIEGKVLCRRFVKCSLCSSYSAHPIYVNLRTQNLHLETLITGGLVCGVCGSNELGFFDPI